MSNQLPADISRQPPARRGAVCGKQIVWKDGAPIALYVEPMTTTNINKLLMAAVQLEYEPTVDENAETHAGKPRLQVALERAATRAAHGDHETLVWLMDRLVGKPLQTQQNLNVSATYEEFAKNLPQPTKEELADIGMTAEQFEDIAKQATAYNPETDDTEYYDLDYDHDTDDLKDV